MHDPCLVDLASRASERGRSNILDLEKGTMYTALTQQLLGPCHAWTGYPKSQNSGHRSRGALDSDLARANAIGAVPIAFSVRKYLSSALERAHWRNEIRPAAR